MSTGIGRLRNNPQVVVYQYDDVDCVPLSEMIAPRVV